MSDRDTALVKTEGSNPAIDPEIDSSLVMPEQFYQCRRPSSQSGEYQLLMAVLREALHTYLTTRSSTSGKRCYDYWEVRRWFESRRFDFLYDFQTICQLLDIDADALRRKLEIGPTQCYQAVNRAPLQHAQASSARRGPRPRALPAKKPGTALVSRAG